MLAGEYIGILGCLKVAKLRNPDLGARAENNSIAHHGNDICWMSWEHKLDTPLSCDALI